MQQSNVVSGSDDHRRANDATLVALLNVLLRRRALIVWFSLLSAFVFTGYSLVGERTWTTTASFFPQGRKASGNLSALAAQFGVPVGTNDANESPAFYADLVKSPAILGTVVDSGVTVQPDGRTVDLATAYKIKTTVASLRRDLALKQLNSDVNVSTNAKTGVVFMRVTSNAPELSTSISLRLLYLLSRFNQNTRRGQASAERKFTEERLALVKKELRAAEDAQQNFLQENRVVAAFSLLKFQEDRLEREVRMQQELYTNLAKAYEQAKIDEVRDTPVITEVEHPANAARPDSRGIATKGIASLIGGFVLGCIVAIILQGLQGTGDSSNAERDEFHELSSVTLRDLRRPWRLLRPIRP